MKFALLVIDMLPDFLDRWEPARRWQLLAGTNTLVGEFHRRSLPVIWIRQEFRADLSDAFLEMRDKQIALTIEGTSGAHIHPDLNVAPEDRVIVKKRYSAFFGTELDTVLSRMDISHLVLAGINTHACVRMTAIDAYQRDIRVFLALDALDSHDADHARISFHYMSGKIAQPLQNADIGPMLDRAAIAGFQKPDSSQQI